MAYPSPDTYPSTSIFAGLTADTAAAITVTATLDQQRWDASLDTQRWAGSLT